MSFAIARQNHIQKKISKNIDKEQKLLDIKTTLDKDFEKFLQEKKCSTGSKLDERKLKIELNQLIFKNFYKEKILQDLKMKVVSTFRHHRSASVSLLTTTPESKISELQNEIQESQKDTEKESEEAELLRQILIREKTGIRFLIEKISNLRENENDLQKFTEKLTRTTVLAGNLYLSSSKVLKNSRKSIHSQTSTRNLSMRNLKKKELILNNQVQLMNSKLTDRIYSESEQHAKRLSLSSRLEVLLLHNKDNELESNSNLRYLNSINFMHEKLVKLIKRSKFIPDIHKDKSINLSELGEFLNKLIFAEAQLQVRCSELINSQSLYKAKVDILKREIKEIKEKFEDSQFIERWNNKEKKGFGFGYLENSEGSKDAYAENLESLCFELLRVLCTIQDHTSKIVKRVNTMSIEILDKFSRTNQLIRKRTLSTRENFTILPVIKEASEMFSPFEFEKLTSSFFMEKFRSDYGKCKIFLSNVNKYNMLKQFLTASDLNEYFAKNNTAEEVLNHIVKLFKPAHKNLRHRISKIVKFSSSFICGISRMYEQILSTFENYTLSDTQFNKYMTLIPGLIFSDLNLRTIVASVVKYQINNIEQETVKKVIKRQRNLKKNTILQEIDSPKEIKEKEIIRIHRRTTSQKEIKMHLDELNIKLVKTTKQLQIDKLLQKND